MSNEKNITFQDTIEWAVTDSARRGTRSKGIPIFYLIVGAIVFLILVILIIYLAGRNPGKEMDALEMMKDNKYIFNEDDSYDESIAEDNSVIYEDEYSGEGSGNYDDDPEVN